MQDGNHLIDQVAAAKRGFDKQIVALDIEYKIKRELAKKGVLEAINAALNAGVSKNRVAIHGMGYAGLSPMVSFMGASGTDLTALQATLEKYSLPSTEGVRVPTKFTKDQVSTIPLYKYIGKDGTKNRVYIGPDDVVDFSQVIMFDKDNAREVLSDFYAEFKNTFIFDEEAMVVIDGRDVAG